MTYIEKLNIKAKRINSYIHQKTGGLPVRACEDLLLEMRKPKYEKLSRKGEYYTISEKYFKTVLRKNHKIDFKIMMKNADKSLKMQKGGTIKTSDGTDGGILQGDSHNKGGIDAVIITDKNRPVELEDKAMLQKGLDKLEEKLKQEKNVKPKKKVIVKTKKKKNIGTKTKIKPDKKVVEDISKLPFITKKYMDIPLEIRGKLNVLSDYNAVLAYWGFKPLKDYINIDFEECDGINVMRDDYTLKCAGEIKKNIDKNIFCAGFKYLKFYNPEQAIKVLKLKPYGAYNVKDKDYKGNPKEYPNYVYTNNENTMVFAVSAYKGQDEEEMKANFFSGNYMSFYCNSIVEYNYVMSYIMEKGEYVKDIDFFYNNKTSFEYADAEKVLGKKNASKKKSIPKPKEPILKKALKQVKTKELTIKKGVKKETHKIVTGFEKDIKDAIMVLNKERYIIREKIDRKTKKTEKVKHSPAYINALIIEKRVNEIFNSSIYDIAKTKKEKKAKKALIVEINEIKELTTLWLNELDIMINQEAKNDLVSIKKLLKGLIKESRKNDPSDKYKLSGRLNKIASKHGF